VAAQLPKEPRVQMLEGQIRLLRRDPKAAEQRFAAALATQPSSYEALGGLVASRLAAGNVQGALAVANNALEKSPTDAKSLVLAARTYGETQDFKTAESLLKRAIEADPALLEAYSMLGQLYVADKRLDDALREFQRLSDLQPTAVGPKTVVAVLHHMANRRAEAKKSYQAVLRVDSSAVVAANNLAWMMVEDNENLDVALQLVQAAKVRSPQSPEVADTLGLIYYRRNLFAFSISAFEDAVKYAPANPEYHYRLGLALSKNNDPVRAKASFRTALALNPAFPGSVDAVAQLAALP
jgi:tetratricopeptide (TPR) repeat protein